MLAWNLLVTLSKNIFKNALFYLNKDILKNTNAVFLVLKVRKKFAQTGTFRKWYEYRIARNFAIYFIIIIRS